MMKMIIVDDEPIIIQGLRYTVPWEEYGLEVVDEAQDGEEALEKIEAHGGVDILLTDVKMPNMDGLELAEKLRDRPGAPKIIMISGYDEFDYAKQAIRMGVKDYLLKPVDIDELLDTVTKVKNTMVQEQETKSHYDQLKIKDYMAHLLLGTPLEFHEEAKDIGHLTIYPFVTSTKKYKSFTMNMTEEDIQKDRQDWQEGIDNLLKQYGWQSMSLFIETNVLLTCVYKWGKEAPTVQKLNQIILEQDSDDRAFHVIASPSTSEFRTLPEFCLKVEGAVQYAFASGRLFLTVKEDHLENIEMVLPASYEDRLLKALNDDDMTHVLSASKEIFNHFDSQGFLLKNVIDECRKLEQKVMDYYETVKRKQMVEGLELNLQEEIPVNVYNAYSLLYDLFEEDIQRLYTLFHPEDKGSHHWLVDRAIQYIHDYYKEEIKASEVADYINISPNYFSAIFKQYTNKNFNEYLNELRVEKAKVLLDETPDKIVDIAEQVGYQNYKYFVQIFKQLTKMTPTEYRRFNG